MIVVSHFYFLVWRHVLLDVLGSISLYVSQHPGALFDLPAVMRAIVLLNGQYLLLKLDNLMTGQYVLRRYGDRDRPVMA